MIYKTLKLDENIEETRILNFMIAIASNIPKQAFSDDSEKDKEYAYKTLDLAIAFNDVYCKHWE